MSVAQPVRIELGQKVGRPLAEGETHPYLVRLEAGEYVRVAAEQRGVDLILRLLAPDGSVIAEVDSPTGTRGGERVSEIAAATGDYRAEVVGTEETPPGEYEIRIEDRRPATEADRQRVKGERAFLEGEDLRRGKKFEEAITRYERALELWRAAGDLRGQAAALYSIGWMRERLDRWEEAARLCGEAAELYRQAADPTGQAQALNRSGRLLARLSRLEEARPRLDEAVHLFRITSDVEGEASALNNLGGAYVREERFRDAVEAYDQVLPLYRKTGDRRGEAVARLTLGLLYLEHGKWGEARDEYEGALRTADAIGERDLAASALDSLGLVEYREGHFVESRARSERSLALYREIGDRQGQALALNSLGSVLLRTGEREAARAKYGEALALFRALGDPQGEATTTSHLGRVALAEGKPGRALELQREALARFEQIEDRQGLSRTHYGIAQALLALDDNDGALRAIETSMELAERQRSTTEILDVRAFYFATRQHYWELYIDVLLAQDRLHPNQGFAARALAAEERRRARSLLDALAEIRAGARQGEVSRREADPRSARIESGETLSLTEIQEQLLDTDTLLLIYSLGEERSILWKVTRSTLASYPLPRREQIDTAAERGHDALSRRLRPGSRLRQTALDDLAELVLKPVAADLPKYRRLLIVADGALHLIPFAALPDLGAAPVNGSRPPLIEGHPVIHLPSASVGATLRRERRGTPLRHPGVLVAVVADPVFEPPAAGEPHPETPPPTRGDASRSDLARSARDLGLTRLEPLPYSREEAEAIHALRPGEVVSALGFAATREILEDERWRHAPILHFATHGLLNDRQPELSGLVFTQFNPDGTPRKNSFLQLRDIYELELDADLVVLSACQTGLGKELRGEGLLGMTRGFLTRGVPQLVVSLWKVEDRATAELMTRFYRELFNGYRPPDALQRAQKSMLREPPWRDPALWAGFIFVGDFERQPGGGIEARDTGGTDPVRKADGTGLPPPKVKRKPPKPKPPNLETPSSGTGQSKEGSGSSPSVLPGSGAQESTTPSSGIRFSSYAPAEISPEAWNTLLAYCFRDSAAQAVAEDSARRLGTQNDQYLQYQVSAARPIAPGSEILIIPELAGCRFNPPQTSILWFEDWHGTQFRFQALRGLPGFDLESYLPGRLSFYESSVLVANVSFAARLTLSPGTEPDRAGFRRTDARPYQSVFISYSRSDSIIVEALEQAYAALGVSSLRDIHFLRPGEEWEPKLLEKIDESDIFQLFWSNSASRSKWVKAEWRHALGLRRSQFIRPVYWEDPMPRPPRELANLHFHHLQLDR